MTSNIQFNNLGAKAFFRIHPLTAISAHPGAPTFPGAVDATKVRAKGNPATQQGGVEKSHRILFANIGPDNSPFWGVFTVGCGQAVKITIGGAAGIPLYHLPYNNDQNWRITLRDIQGVVGGVDFFVTELVNGCSVYVEGTAQEPTVYHINAISSQRGWSFWSPFLWTQNSRRRADWIAKYRRMDDRFRNDTQKPKNVRNAVLGLLQAAKVENDDYMTPTAMEGAVEAQLATFQAQGKSPVNLAGQSVDRMRFVLSEGSVFGVRTGGNWKFYIQKRVLVEYFHDSPLPNPPVSLGRQQIILAVTQFWPNPKSGRFV